MRFNDYEIYHLHEYVYSMTEIDNKIKILENLITNLITNKKQYITIWAEENGSINNGRLEWSFGNGKENNPNYGYCMPVNGKVKYATLSANANSSTTGEIRVNIIINGVENTSYTIIKNPNEFSSVTTFQIPLDVNAGDRINFKSKTTNAGVSQAIVSLLIEIDI